MDRQAAKAAPDAAARMLRKVRLAERRDGNGNPIGGTGFTVLRLRQPPMASLINRRDVIGSEEVRAADEIASVFLAITGGLLIKPQGYERVDRSMAGNEPGVLIDAHARYRAFARYWSDMAKRGHPLLEVVIAAVIDERSFRLIEADVGLRHGKAEAVLIGGLRDYAARAGWVRDPLKGQWQRKAYSLFKLRREPLDIGDK